MSENPPEKPPEFVLVPGSYVEMTIPQEHITEFYSLIGKCTTQWAQIERELFNACVWALGVDEKRAAAVFYAWPTLGSRRTLTSELVGIAAPDDAAWKTIVEAFEKHQPFRNTLAHEPVRHQFEVIWDMWADGGPKAIKSGGRLEVHTEPKKLLRGKHKGEQVVSIEQLNAHLEAVRNLVALLQAFVKTKKAESPEQAAPLSAQGSPDPASQNPHTDPEPD